MEILYGRKKDFPDAGRRESISTEDNVDSNTDPEEGITGRLAAVESALDDDPHTKQIANENVGQISCFSCDGFADRLGNREHASVREVPPT